MVSVQRTLLLASGKTPVLPLAKGQLEEIKARFFGATAALNMYAGKTPVPTLGLVDEGGLGIAIAESAEEAKTIDARSMGAEFVDAESINTGSIRVGSIRLYF
ncbi:MAG: hypothetical protein VKL39_02720 [Leptolyngbyaceae bacterium]|nr:hypothetical protein [Leptolyngbyaceae bacterium]